MHTYARLSGFGWSIVPYAPYLVRRLGDGSDGCISIEAAGRQALLDPNGENVTGTLRLVADVEATSSTSDWVIEFAAFHVAWPNHFALASSELAGVPFDLIGCDGVLFPQRPNNPVPGDDALVAPGQRLTARGDEDGFRWVELHYELDDGDAWLQRHYLLPDNWVITMQEPRKTVGLVIDVAQGLAEQMTAQLRS